MGSSALELHRMHVDGGLRLREGIRHESERSAHRTARGRPTRCRCREKLAAHDQRGRYHEPLYAALSRRVARAYRGAARTRRGVRTRQLHLSGRALDALRGCAARWGRHALVGIRLTRKSPHGPYGRRRRDAGADQRDSHPRPAPAESCARAAGVANAWKMSYGPGARGVGIGPEPRMLLRAADAWTRAVANKL